jgi:hypothetical protein
VSGSRWSGVRINRATLRAAQGAAVCKDCARSDTALRDFSRSAAGVGAPICFDVRMSRLNEFRGHVRPAAVDGRCAPGGMQ